jgi:hypothetical protein
VRHLLTPSPLSSGMPLTSFHSEMLSVPPRPLVACRLVDRLPLVVFLINENGSGGIREGNQGRPGAGCSAGPVGRRLPRKWRAPWRAP